MVQYCPRVFITDHFDHLDAYVVHIFKAESCCVPHSLSEVLYQFLGDEGRDVRRVDVHQSVQALHCEDYIRLSDIW